MVQTTIGRGWDARLSPPTCKKPTPTPILNPEGYMGVTSFTDTPNILHISKHTYYKEHGKFTSTETEEKYMQLLEKNSKQCANSINKMSDIDKQWQGGTIPYHDNWPDPKASTFRIQQLNLNGINFKNDNFLIDVYLQGTMSLQIDIGLCQEINLRLNNSEIRKKLTKSLKRFDRHTKATYGYISKQQVTKGKYYQPGGNMVWTQGQYSNRVIDTGHDQFGRWSYTTLLAKNNRKICFISAYKTCKSSKYDGTGIASQQFRAMAAAKHPESMNQRKAFDNDIEKFLTNLRTQGILPFITMDSNTPTNSNEMKSFLAKTGLINVFTHVNQSTPEPRTYFRGSDCIDVALTCPQLIDGITRASFAPFYTMGPYDHRMLIIDLDRKFFFDYTPDLTKTGHTAFTYNNVKAMKKYIHNFRRFLNKAKIIKTSKYAIKQLAQENLPEEEKKRHIEKLKLNKKLTNQLAIGAAKKCCRNRPTTFMWSPKFAEDGKLMRYWNERLALSNIGIHDHRSLPFPKGLIVTHASTEEEVTNEHARVVAQWIKTKDRSGELHLSYVNDLVERIAEERGITEEQARKQLYNQELSKAKHQKHGLYMKDRRHGMIDSVIVPEPSSINPTAETHITDEKDLAKVLLARNSSKLTAANISPFSTGPLAAILDENGDCETSKSIIDGTFDYNIIHTMNLPHQSELISILRALKRPLQQNGKPIPDIPTSITKEDYDSIFSKKNDATACGPRGMSMTHWKIATLDEEIATLHALLMSAPFTHGFSYDEWEISVHCMLLKDLLPLYHRLRIIQLYEGDFNGSVNLLLGRRLMYHGMNYNLNSHATFGGRKMKGCHQALLRIQYTAEISRLQRKPIGLIDIDAKGCFDRMVGCLLSLVNQHRGASQTAAACQARIIHNMKHYVKTKFGMSDAYIQRTPTCLLEGNGQGNGSSMEGWHGHNELLHAVYKQQVPGSEHKNPTGTITFTEWLISFVDDNKLFTSFPPFATHAEILEQCKQCLEKWEILLNITGGSIELKKCLITLMVYEYDSSYKKIKGQPYRPGYPCLTANRNIQGTCMVQTCTGPCKVRRQEPTTGERLLGVRLAADGSFHEEYTYRLNQSITFGTRLAQAPFDKCDAWQVYYARYKPAITYCLPITTFSDKQCDRIQSQFYRNLLPKIGLNRHFPLAIRYGPYKYGGLEMLDIKTEQLATHVHDFIGHLRHNSRIGQSMSIAIDSYQLYLGTATHFFTECPQKFDYRPPVEQSPITYLWEQLAKSNAKIESEQFWNVPKKYANDTFLMDDFRSLIECWSQTINHFPPSAIWTLNACRLHLRVTLRSDILTPPTTHVLPHIFYGRCPTNSILDYPNQPKPPAEAWKLWRKALFGLYITGQGRSSYCLPTLRPLHLTYSQPSITWEQHISSVPTVTKAIEYLPQYYHQVLGEVHLPPDNCEAIAALLQSGITLHAWSDGTVKDEKGAHSYTLRTPDDDPETCVHGSAITTCDPTSLTSLRTEHYGGLAISILLKCIVAVHKISPQLPTYIEHRIDNDTVIDRITKAISPNLPAVKRNATDYDVWSQHCYINSTLPVNLIYIHVKGHQADALFAKYGVRGPLPRNAYYNEWCDELAATCRETQPKITHTIAFPQSSPYLRVHDTIVTASPKTAVIRINTEPQLKTYVLKKNEYDLDTFHLVDWDSFSQYFKSLPITKRTKVSKLVHDWQHTGYQKQLFHDSQTNSKKTTPAYGCDENIDDLGTEIGQCPYNCGLLELPLHYLTCEENPKPHQEHMRQCLNSINAWMETTHTPTLLRLSMYHHLKHFLFPTAQRRWDIHDEPNGPRIQEALDTQTTIGWDQAFKGRISIQWKTLMQHHYDTTTLKLPKHYSGKWWSAKLIRLLIYFTLTCWQLRNNYLHDNENASQEEKRRITISENICHAYATKSHPYFRSAQSYFRKPLLLKLQETTAELERWLETVNLIYDLNNDTAAE